MSRTGNNEKLFNRTDVAGKRDVIPSNYRVANSHTNF